MAEVGQSILREHNIGIVRVMQAKGVARLVGLQVWQGTCNAIYSRLP